jgi:hypothetical protein
VTATLKGSIRNLELLVSKRDGFLTQPTRETALGEESYSLAAIPFLFAIHRDQIASGWPAIQHLSCYQRLKVAFPENHPLRPEDLPTARPRLRRKRRTLARLPHVFISHQRRIPLRLLSTNNHEQFSPKHCRTRVNASDLRRSAAELATSCETRSKAPSHSANDGERQTYTSPSEY